MGNNQPGDFRGPAYFPGHQVFRRGQGYSRGFVGERLGETVDKFYDYTVNNELLNVIKKQFKLDLNGDHGIEHWERVAKIGEFLATKTGADKEVVGLFAYLHDAKREDELFDPEHGAKAAEYVKELVNSHLLSLTSEQINQLITACLDHNNSAAKSQDITIQTCWDSDRLDLYRVGITPNPKLLFTTFAKLRKGA